MARSWTSYEEVTPHEPVDGRDINQTYYDDNNNNNNDNGRSRPRGNTRRYLCTCLIAFVAIFGVLVGTYFILDHYQKLPSSLQFTHPPPTAAPIAYKTTINTTSSPTAASILAPTGNFTGDGENSTLAPPSYDLSVYCNPSYIDVNTDLECSSYCKPGQCCSAQNEMESCLEANMATCKLYSACKVLLAPNNSTSDGNGTTNSTGDTATTGSIAPPTEDLSSICSQDYFDANTNMECMTVCIPAECCLPSATDSCLMDNLETCLMYKPCSILVKEDSSTNGMLPPEGFNDTMPTLNSYCGDSKMISDPVCSTTICTSDEECSSKNTRYPVCLATCGPSASTTTTGNPPLDYYPQGVDTTGSNLTDLLLNSTGDATSTLPIDMNSTGSNDTSTTTADGMNGLDNTMPSGMLPLEVFNDTNSTLHSYCGKFSSNIGSDPVCSTTNCTSDEECFSKNTKYPVCLATCGPSGGPWHR